MSSSLSQVQDFYTNIPKVELHRHLEGSLRLETLLEIADKYPDILPARAELPELVQIYDDERTSNKFLSKFQALRYFYRTPEIINRLAYEVVEDAAADGVVYMELRFAPVALTYVQKIPQTEVVDLVIESVRNASRDFGIMTRLIITVNRHEDTKSAEMAARLAYDHLGDGIVALDLAGNEAEFPAQPFVDILREAKQSGLALTIHAGEWSGADNVRHALEALEADRIGHGVRVVEDDAVVDIALQRQTAFEVCVTSNYQSGVVENLNRHPILRMLEKGINVTVNTDDPGISRITLSDDYRLICDTLGLPRKSLGERVLAAAGAAFLPALERSQLVNLLEAKLEKHLDF